MPGLLLDLALRTLDQQRVEVEDVRGRIGVLLAAGAVVISVLGGSALATNGLTPASGCALCAFALTLIAALSALWPKRLSTSIDTAHVYAALANELDPVRAVLDLVLGLETAARSNERLIDRQRRAVVAVVVGTGSQTLLWMLGLVVR